MKTTRVSEAFSLSFKRLASTPRGQPDASALQEAFGYGEGQACVEPGGLKG